MSVINTIHEVLEGQCPAEPRPPAYESYEAWRKDHPAGLSWDTESDEAFAAAAKASLEQNYELIQRLA